VTAGHELRFQPIGRRITVPADTTVFAAARQAGIELTSACGGEGRCGLCRVEAVSGDVSRPEAAELAVLGSQVEEGLRLACRLRIGSDVVVRIPASSMLSGPRLQVDGIAIPVELDPVVQAYQVRMEPPTLTDPRADLDRVIAGLADEHGIEVDGAPLPVIRALSGPLRDHDWSITAFVRGDQLVGVAEPGSAPLGLAVDLGTTKIAAHLLDLATGDNLGAAGVPNPQIAYGEDVISRLEHVYRTPEGGDQLAGVVRAAIDVLAGDLIEQAGMVREQLVDVCIVGNTAMVHLLLGYPIRQLIKSPFVASSARPANISAADISLQAAPGALVHVPGSIGGFVGADHVAMILASGIGLADRTVLGIDIGTNTEIVLSKAGVDRLTATSCASGPAFEGAHISDGMRAAAGAIERLTITEAGVEYQTIEDAPPIGLCGSGIVDAVAELHRRGIVNPRGRFEKDDPRVTTGEGGPQLVLAPAASSGSGRDVVITQHDVNEIQLAKGAIHAGAEILLELTGTSPEEVDIVLIAGAFGSFLTVDSALDIGLLPRLPRAGYRQVGNAAVVGAVRMLVSAAERRRAEGILDNTGYEELTVQPVFGRRFAMGMLLPDLEATSNMERTG
jgi:uncharacterized 2Fe-2S/4Fe-4S cluster protein (DUF4445 family)